MVARTVILAPLSLEFEIFLHFSRRDWSATIIPGSIFAVGAVRSSQPTPSLMSMISRYILLLSWLTPYVYFFNLFSQIMGVDEDWINKPDRPIPSGKVTLNRAKWRCVIALLAFLSIPALEPSLLPETLCWVSVVVFLCLTPAGNHWFGKSCVAMALGVWSLLGASWKAIAPGMPKNERNILAVSVWAGLLTQIQDLRDVKGDIAVGRKTMPIVFGDMTTRRVIVALLMPAALLALWVGDILSTAPFTLTVAHVFLAYRVMQIGGPRYDHQTYMVSHHQFINVSLMLLVDLHLHFLPDAFFHVN